MRALLAAVLAFGLATPVLAGSVEIEARYTEAFKTCPGLERSTMEMIECIDAEYARQDARLNAAYRDAMAELNTRQKSALRAAQRAWIAYRDANCASLTDEDWGSLSRITANQCMLNETIRRTIELETYPGNGIN